MITNKLLILFLIISAVQCHEPKSQSGNGTSGLNVSRNLKNKINKALSLLDFEMCILRPFREMCQRNGGPGAFNQARDALTEITMCYNGVIYGVAQNQSAIRDSIYGVRWICPNALQLEQCFNTTKMAALRACMDSNERRNLETGLKVWHDLLDFVCFNECERLVKFFEESEPACLNEQDEALTQCFDEMTNMTWPYLHQQHRTDVCVKYTEVWGCLVGALGRCERPYPADFVNALFGIVGKLICEDQASHEEGAHGELASRTTTEGARVGLPPLRTLQTTRG